MLGLHDLRVVIYVFCKVVTVLRVPAGVESCVAQYADQSG